MWHVQETGEAYSVFWWEDLSNRDHLVDPGVDRTIILKWFYKGSDGDEWIAQEC